MLEEIVVGWLVDLTLTGFECYSRSWPSWHWRDREIALAGFAFMRRAEPLVGLSDCLTELSYLSALNSQLLLSLSISRFADGARLSSITLQSELD